MSPTATHLDLLRQLPHEVLKRLQEIGPGWPWYFATPAPVLLDQPWAEYRSSTSTGQETGFMVGYWLPCSESALLELAGDLWPHGAAITLQILSDDHQGQWSASIDTKGGFGAGYGDDAHEAALNLLLLVIRRGEG